MFTSAVTIIAAVIIVVIGVIAQVLEWVDRLDKHPLVKRFVESKILRVSLLVVAIIALAGVAIDLNGVREILNTPPPPPKPPRALTAQELAPCSAPIVTNPKSTPAKSNDGGTHIQGGVTQQGKINQIGPNNQATINEEPLVWYDFDGSKHVRQGNSFSVEAGNPAFDKMRSLEQNKDWSALRDAAEKAVKDTPDWPTPYGELSLAYENLCQKEQAITNARLFLDKVKASPESGGPQDTYVNASAFERKKLAAFKSGKWPDRCN